MSLYDDASLIMYPSGYKEDKIYSLKPTDGSGDLTFTRASTATRVNAEGLIETSPVNLLTYSNDFSNAAWLKDRCTLTYGQSGYDGTSNAWLMQSTATALSSRCYQVFSGSNNFNRSVYAKKGTSDYVAIYTTSSGYAYFNLSNGTIGTQSNNINASILSVGDGWYRCSVTMSSIYDNHYIFVANSDNITTTNSGDNIYIQDAQLNIGTTAKPYFPTTDRLNVPRIDYTGGGCGSLLLEKQSTNLAFPSEDLTALTTGGMTNTANQTISPDGTQNADKSTIGTTTRFYDVITEPIIVATIGTTYTTSFFAKKGTGIESIYFFQGDGIRIAKFNLNNGAYIGHSPSDGYNAFSSYSSQSLGNGWYRFTATYTAATTVGKFVIGVSTNTNNSVTAISGNGTDFVYVWGLQYEIGSYVSSYIPTVASSVTRLADSASKTGISSLIGQTQGTLFVDIDVINLNPSNVSRIILSDGTTNNYIFLGINEAGSGNLSRLFINNFGTSFSLSLFSSTAITIGLHKLALAYKSGEFALYLDGNSVASSSATGTIPATSQIVIGGTSPSTISNLETLVLNKSILFPTRLTNTELQSLTSL